MLSYLTRLTGRDREEFYDDHLAHFLTFIAGAANAGGFMAFQRYTSHMTGIASASADALAIGDWRLFLAGLIAIIAFISGAAFSAILINWGRRKNLHSQFAVPLLLESLLLGVFGFLGDWMQQFHAFYFPATALLLCFIMGLQNAMITKMSGARIRTTHITGMVTDIGIEIGKSLYWNRDPAYSTEHHVRGDRKKIGLLLNFVALFFLGGLAGGIGYNWSGFIATLFLATLLFLLAIMPVLQDIIRSNR